MIARNRLCEELLLSRSKPEGACRIWTGTIRKGDGTGQVEAEGKIWYAHRAAYEVFIGPILPPNAVVLRTCHNKLCIAPNHLVLGSRKDVDFHNPSSLRRIGWKLSEDDVRAIRASNEKSVTLAKMYGISESYVSLVRRNKKRRFVT